MILLPMPGSSSWGAASMHDYDFDEKHPEADDKSNTGWSIHGARRKHRTTVTETCFIGGLAEDTTAEQLVLGAKIHGVEIKKSHMLPINERFPDSRAAKVYIARSNVDLALQRDFWPRGVWCRPWRSSHSAPASSD